MHGTASPLNPGASRIPAAKSLQGKLRVLPLLSYPVHLTHRRSNDPCLKDTREPLPASLRASLHRPGPRRWQRHPNWSFHLVSGPGECTLVMTAGSMPRLSRLHATGPRAICVTLRTSSWSLCSPPLSSSERTSSFLPPDFPLGGFFFFSRPRMPSPGMTNFHSSGLSRLSPPQRGLP